MLRLLEYALGSSDDDPASGHDRTSITIEPYPETAGDTLVFSFRRNLAARDVRFTVEHSPDLVTWAPGVASLIEEINLGDGTALVRYHAPLSGDPGHLRLRVTME